jgi:hypothetical protein
MHGLQFSACFAWTRKPKIAGIANDIPAAVESSATPVRVRPSAIKQDQIKLISGFL